MGSRHSRTEEVRQDPRSFFLIFGTPSIRYTKERTRGPLLYDVDLDEGDDQAVVHADTLQLDAAVAPKQAMELVPIDSTNPRSGYALSFTVSYCTTGHSLRVYCGADVKYSSGSELRLVQSEKEHTPFCVLNTTISATQGEEVRTTETIHLDRLRPVAFSDEKGKGNRLSYAPIVVELGLLPGRAEDTELDQSADEKGMGKNLVAGERTVQYTFLELPKGVSKADAAAAGGEQRPGSQQSAGTAPAAASSPTASTNYEVSVAKQLLLHDGEMFELHNLYDIGAADHGDAEEDEEMDEEDLCVICLTNSIDTTILPCRHMCLCYDCAGQLRLQNNKCPMCRTEIDRVITL